MQMRTQNSLSVEKKSLRLDEVHFIRSWLEKPLSTGAVLPSGKALARTMARYVDPLATGPVIELGPGTGAVTEALVLTATVIGTPNCAPIPNPGAANLFQDMMFS